jgi:hypothetical protein
VSSERIRSTTLKRGRQKLTGVVDRSVRGLMDLDFGIDGFCHTCFFDRIDHRYGVTDNGISPWHYSERLLDSWRPQQHTGQTTNLPENQRCQRNRVDCKCRGLASDILQLNNQHHRVEDTCHYYTQRQESFIR